MFVHTRLPPPPARVLNLGGAASTYALELAAFGYRVVGVDRRPQAIRHPSVTMIRADVEQLPLADAGFDVAISPAGLDRLALAEVRRVLRCGGRLLAALPFGRLATSSTRMIYDHSRLKDLLQSFRPVEILYGIRNGEGWSITTDADAAERLSAVALIVAEKL